MITGVLFLTAGYGIRAEPFSLYRPKCLLPWQENTVLGSLALQLTQLKPEIVACNASRCPELIRREMKKYWNGRFELLFEERPLGTAGTLARNAELIQGNWIICNTDFCMDIPLDALVKTYSEKDTGWTVLTGKMPEYGSYRALEFEGEKRHYTGISVISGEVASAAAEEQISGGVFSDLRRAAYKKGISLSQCFTCNRWLDLGETELFRKHTLEKGSYIHPSAVVEDGAVLQGFYYVGAGCIIRNGGFVRNSVLLEGSEVGAGCQVEGRVFSGHFCRGK
ncbi:hypothetical protein CSA37_02835 [Candidatus Fermentibacteria bacterium]|nr:MAG: hypothetical protein CSA37_02835 [Candidatus Fermentibacteria bacterium]